MNELNTINPEENINIHDEPKNKGLTYSDNWYKKLSDKYYSVIDKLHLRSITNVIDKVMPSMIFFLILFVLIIALVIYFAAFSSSLNEYTLKINLDGKALSESYSIVLTSKEEVTLDGTGKNVKGPIIFYAKDNSTITAKVTLKGLAPIIKQFKADKEEITLNLVSPSNSNSSNANKQKENLFSFVFNTQNGFLEKEGKIKLECNDYSQELPVTKGTLSDIKINCDNVNVTANVENYPTVSTVCNPGLCRLMFVDNLSKAPVALSKNKLVVYVNFANNEPAKGINVEVREKLIGNELIDQGVTKDFGSYSLDLSEGKYSISISDPLNVYGVQTQDIEVTAGNQSPIYFILREKAIGNLKIDFDVEDNNYLSGTLFLKDSNQLILQSIKFDSNVNSIIPISKKGKYILSASLDNMLSNDYVVLPIEVNYEKDSGDVDLKYNIRKTNSFTDQNVIVQVIDSYSQKPIPYAKIWFTTSTDGSLLDFGTDGIFITTDINGIYSKIIPKGNYNVNLKHYKLKGIVSFSVEETKSLTMTTKNVVLPVAWGNATLKVCLKDSEGEDLNDASIEIYSIDGIEASFYLSPSENCATKQVKSLKDIYFRVVKVGYFEKYTQTYFVENNGSYDIDIVLDQTIPVNPVEKLETKFVGIYNDLYLKKPATELNNSKDYYYAFKVRVPKAYVNANRTIKFLGVAGDLKDENSNISKMLTRLVNDSGIVNYYANYKQEYLDNLSGQVLEIEDDYTYRAKSFANIHKFNNLAESDVELEYVVKNSITMNANPNAVNGDSIIFNYGFGIDNEKINLTKVVKKLGTNICEDTICVDVYDFENNSISELYNAPSTGKLFGKVRFDNEDYNLGIYNAKENNGLSVSEINDLTLALTNAKYNLINVDASFITKSMSNGPIYVYDQEVSQGQYLTFDFDYSLISDESTILHFNAYKNKFDLNNKLYSLKFVAEETEKLEIEYPEFIVPYIENKLKLIVLGKDNYPVVNAQVKYYEYSNNNWKLINNKTGYTNEVGNIEIVTNPIAREDKIKLVVIANGYKTSVQEIIADFDFDVPESLDVIINYPSVDSQNDVDKEVNFYNTLGYDLNIYDLKYVWDYTKVDSVFLSRFLNEPKMLSKFANGYILNSLDNNQLKLKVVYDKELLSNLDDSPDFSGSLYFKYLPLNSNINLIENSLDTKMFFNIPFNLKFKFSGEPDSDNCILSSFETLEGQNINSITFLNDLEKTVKLKVINNCTINGLNYSFDDLQLILDTKTDISLSIVDDLTGKNLFTGQNSEKNPISLYSSAKSNTEMYYTITIKVASNFNDLLYLPEGSKVTLSPDFVVKYNNDGKIREKVFNSNNSLNLEFESTENCLTFGISDSMTKEKYLLKDNNDVIIFPYYLAKEEEFESSDNKRPIAKGTDSVESGEYVSNILDVDYSEIELKIKNSCGVPREIKLCNENDIYCKTNDVFLDITSANFNFNLSKVINDESEIIFTIRRPDNFSGAVVLYLYDVVNGTERLIKELKINVQSSNENVFFVNNPFVSKSFEDYIIYRNEYYPIGFSDNLINDVYAGYPYPGEAEFDAHYYQKSNAKNDYHFDIWSFLFAMIPGLEDVSKDEYKNTFKQIRKNTGFALFFNSEENYYSAYDSCDAESQDESASLKYYIFDKGILVDDNPNMFFNFFEKTKNLSLKNDFIDNEKTSEYYRYLAQLTNEYGKKIMNNQNFPYFISLGGSNLEGDGEGDGKINAATFCPYGFDPVRINLYDEHHDLDDWAPKYDSIDNILDTKANVYLYGGLVNLESACMPDYGNGKFKILTICRLNELNFTQNIDRPTINKSDYSIEGNSILIFDKSSNTLLNNSLLSNPKNLLSFDKKKAMSELVNRLNELNSEFKDLGYSVNLPGSVKLNYDLVSCNDDLLIIKNDIKLSDSKSIEFKAILENFNYTSLVNDFLQQKGYDGKQQVSAKCENNVLVLNLGNNSYNYQFDDFDFLKESKYWKQDTLFEDYLYVITDKLKDNLSDIENISNYPSFNQVLKDNAISINCNNCGIDQKKLKSLNTKLSEAVKQSTGSIRMYSDLPKPKYLGESNLNCFGGGATGKSVLPQLNLYNDNVDCSDNSNYGCNLPQFAKYITNNTKDLNFGDKAHFRVKLVYDNYSKDGYDAYKNNGFLTNNNLEMRFLTMSGNPFSISNNGLGVYAVDAYKDSDNNYRVYIVYDTYVLPDHLFYYMPYLENAKDKLGTSINGILHYTPENTYTSNNDDSALFNYKLENIVYKDNDYPRVISGKVSLDNLGGVGDISFSPNSLKISKIDLAKGTYKYTFDSSITYANIFLKDQENKVYPASILYDVSQNSTSITILEKQNIDYSEYELYLVTVTNNKDVQSISNIVDEINLENICYILKDNEYIYYWNILKKIQEFD